jgi:hypothetical protein
VNKEVPFDKDKFINHCCIPCNNSRKLFLDKIEQYRQSEPDMVRYMEWYRDRLWLDQVKGDQYRKLRMEKGDKQLNKEAAAALRAMADKIEQPGCHFMIHCELPELPILSGDDHYCAKIDVGIVSGPLGG